MLALFAAYVGVSRIRFDVGAGYVSAEQLVYVPLLFFAPLPLVLLLVPVAFALSDLPDILAGRAHRDRWMNALADSWYVIGSVSVLGFFAPGSPQLELVPVYLGALAAQVGLGTGAALAREYFVGRLSVRDELRSSAAAYQLDVVLSPVGLGVAFAAAELGALALLTLVPAAWGLFWLSGWHRARCDRLVAEHEAYWRRFLRDARRLERCAQPAVSDDWRCMPELALAVGAALRLDMDLRVSIAQAAQAAARRSAVSHDAADRPERRLQLAAALIEERLYYAGADPLISRPAVDRLREQAEPRTPEQRALRREGITSRAGRRRDSAWRTHSRVLRGLLHDDRGNPTPGADERRDRRRGAASGRGQPIRSRNRRRALPRAPPRRARRTAPSGAVAVAARPAASGRSGAPGRQAESRLSAVAALRTAGTVQRLGRVFGGEGRNQSRVRNRRGSHPWPSHFWQGWATSGRPLGSLQIDRAAAGPRGASPRRGEHKAPGRTMYANRAEVTERDAIPSRRPARG